MKIRLAVSEESYDRVAEFLTSHGFELDDSAGFVLSESERFVSHIPVRDQEGRRLHIATEDIIYIESYGHTVEVHTVDGTYETRDRLYELCYMLDPARFLRISNSVIIERGKVKKIIPSLSMKFVLVMSDGRKLDVTRTYYNIFKEYFGI